MPLSIILFETLVSHLVDTQHRLVSLHCVKARKDNTPVGMSHSLSMDSFSHFRDAQNERDLVLHQTMFSVNTLSLLSKQVGSEDENSVF